MTLSIDLTYLEVTEVTLDPNLPFGEIHQVKYNKENESVETPTRFLNNKTPCIIPLNSGFPILVERNKQPLIYWIKDSILTFLEKYYGVPMSDFLYDAKNSIQNVTHLDTDYVLISSYASDDLTKNLFKLLGYLCFTLHMPNLKRGLEEDDVQELRECILGCVANSSTLYKEKRFLYIYWLSLSEKERVEELRQASTLSTLIQELDNNPILESINCFISEAYGMDFMVWFESLGIS